MTLKDLARRTVLLVTMMAACPGCGDEKAPATADRPAAPAGAPTGGAGAGASAAAPAAEANHIVGRVTMGDGKPLGGDVKDVQIAIQGVSEAGGRVSYSPAVKPDGTYRQKVAPGQYSFGRCRIVVRYDGVELPFPLEPVGNLWNKDRDAADGIVQDFAWKVTGVTPYGQANGANPADATHWYGMSVDLSPGGWREDLKKAPATIPDGTKLVFTLKPLGRVIDGSEPKPITVERTHSAARRTDPDLNDLPPAPYEMTGTAKLPDGTEKPLLLQGGAEYPAYKPAVRVPLELDGLLGKMAKRQYTFVID